MLIHTSLYGRPRHKSASSLQRHFISQHILRNIMKTASRQATTHKTQQTNTLTHINITYSISIVYLFQNRPSANTQQSYFRQIRTFSVYMRPFIIPYLFTHRVRVVLFNPTHFAQFFSLLWLLLLLSFNLLLKCVPHFILITRAHVHHLSPCVHTFMCMYSDSTSFRGLCEIVKYE